MISAIFKNKAFPATLGLTLLFSIIAVWPLLSNGLPPTHDGEYHVIRFFEFNKALMDGNFYPLWASDLNFGFGVPLFNYVYPLPNYIASFLHLFNVSFIDAFKLNMFFSSIIGAIFLYLWSRKFWGDLGGVISSVFYTFSPYHLLDIYVRGSVGELWTLAFFPGFLWSITSFLRESKEKFIPLSGIFLALIIFSHNILALMFFGFSFFYILIIIFQSNNKKYLILNTFCIILLGLGLSSIFWLPALFERQLVTGLLLYNVKENFAEIYQLIFPSWGSGFSNGELQNQMSLQIGIANLIVIFVTLFTFPLWVKKKVRSLIAFFLLSFLFIFFLMIKPSLFIWNMVPLMDYFQFPWRLLSLEIIVCSFLAGSILNLFKHKAIRLTLAFILIFSVFLFGIGYAKPAFYHLRDDNYYISRSNFIDGTNSPGDYFNTIWAGNPKKRQKEKLVVSRGFSEIKSMSIKSSEYKFNVNVYKKSDFILNTLYFPGWQVFANKNKAKLSKTENGLMSFSLEKGKYLAEIKLEDTPIRKISKIIFFVTLLIIFILFKKSYYVKIKK